MSLNAENVCIKRGDRLIVEDISLILEPGQFLAIAGTNGSGKSTLLGGLSRELPLESGSVSIDGVTLDHWHPRDLAQRRAVLAQESKLSFPFAVLDVVLMGRTAHNQGVESVADIEIVSRALERAGLQGFENRPYTSLSGGERQRVHLARVLAQVWGSGLDGENEHESTPSYLMLDEPTASQDLASQHRVLSCARDFADSGAGVVCVLHDLNQVAQYADRVLLLSDGKAVAYGEPRNILTPHILEPVYGVPIEVVEDERFSHPIILSRRPQIDTL